MKAVFPPFGRLPKGPRFANESLDADTRCGSAFSWPTPQLFGKMRVYTTYGVGTWGPPVRLGTKPEIVVITFA